MAFRRAIFGALWADPVRSVLIRLPIARRIYDGWSRPHPFDRTYGVDTSGSVAAVECAPDAHLASQISPYGGSQPSIVRTAIDALPAHDRYAIVDLGCGKGRPLIVASEFPFASITGVELSASLAEIAVANTRRIVARYPSRTPIEVRIGDATTVDAPGPFVVYYMYHPFNRALVSAMIANVEQQLASRLQHAFFVYYNPVHGDVLDQSTHFSRWYARTLPYAPEELGFGPDLADTVVIWQTSERAYPATSGAGRRIVVRSSAEHASLGD